MHKIIAYLALLFTGTVWTIILQYYVTGKTIVHCFFRLPKNIRNFISRNNIMQMYSFTTIFMQRQSKIKIYLKYLFKFQV